MKFKNLHDQEKSLVIANVWDVPSARVAEKLGYQAIGTSSSAIAALLGYNDGEEMEYSELEYFVKRIKANSNLPLSVDLESGYSRNPIEIANYIIRMADIGVVGINLEDSIVEKERTLLNENKFSEILSEVVEYLQRSNVNLFLNIRTDTFLLGVSNVIEETKKRIHLYENAGANGIFVPCIQKRSDIKEIVECTKLPVNVMCMPELPDFDTISDLGVKRISMGNFLFDKMYNGYEHIAKEVMHQKSFKSIFE